MTLSFVRRSCCRVKTLGAAVAFAAGLAGAERAGASGLEFFMGNVFSGTAASGPAPWAEVIFQDVTAGNVSLTITSLNITSGEKVTELYLNLNPNLNPGSLNFAFQSGSSGVAAPQPSLGVNSFKADGDGKYDILFDFSQTPAQAFSAADYLTYSITGIPTLTSLDFNYLSAPAGGHGPFVAAIHIQGINASSVSDSGSYSGWISPSQVVVVPVPEPSSWALWVLAMGVAASVRARANRAGRKRHSIRCRSSGQSQGRAP